MGSTPDPGPRPVVRLVDLILGEAIAREVEQIHIDSATGAVRYQLAGSWHPVMNLPLQSFPMVLNRIRVLARLDRTKGKQRQEGEMKVRAGEVLYGIRVVVQYTEGGDEESFLQLRREQGMPSLPPN